MKGKTNPKRVSWLRRKVRVRMRIQGTTERPRLCVFRSNRHLYAQVIDDSTGRTLAAASTLTPDLKPTLEGGLKKKAETVGEAIAKVCLSKGIEKVVFDRNGFTFRAGGRIDAIAAGARKAGLKF